MPPVPKSPKSKGSSAPDAGLIAARALEFLATDEANFERFLSITGVTLDAVRHEAGQPAFLGAVLDFLLGDEPLLIEFAAAIGVAPESVMRIRQKLPG